MTDTDKPSIEEVLKYATKQIGIYIGKIASTLPHEQRDEASQNALLRVLEAYKRIDASKGWKSFVQRHCSGAILDYIRWGTGFEEVTLRKPTDDDNIHKKPWRLKTRLQIVQEHEGEISLDSTLGFVGIFETQPDIEDYKPNWALIARMASQDVDIHLVAKLMLGFTQTELSSMFKVSRERLTQRLQEFCNRLDDPMYLGSRWVAQTIFAFGLCSKFHQPEIDLGFGWEHDPVDLWATDINYIERLDPQMSFDFNSEVTLWNTNDFRQWMRSTKKS